MFQIWHQVTSAIASLVMLPAVLLESKTHHHTPIHIKTPRHPPPIPNPSPDKHAPTIPSTTTAAEATIITPPSTPPSQHHNSSTSSDNQMNTNDDDTEAMTSAGATPNGVHGSPSSTTSSSLDDFLTTTRAQFANPLDPPLLLRLSAGLQEQFKEKLQSSSICMLPSYNHTLPTGTETGKLLALDVGGSNFRVALVELQGRGAEGKSGMRIVKQFGHKIDGETRALKGNAFFDWMAGKIAEAVADEEVRRVHGPGTYVMGLAWSFPVEQTSMRTGNLLEMGKHFDAAHGVVGEDLGELLMRACRAKDLDVRIEALINDGSATLISRAYLEPTTRFGLILGTGTNMSVILPVHALHPSKFGNRPQEWYDKAERVLVNTEFSMFGKGLLPMTKFDHFINDTHRLPDFQPYEHLLSGGYLGEIARLVLKEAVEEHGLFGGKWPSAFEERYSFSTKDMASIEQADPTTLCTTVLTKLKSPAGIHPHHASTAQSLIRLVSTRAAALLATAIHALWTLRYEAEGESALTTPHVAIGCNGSVIELYPHFRSRCQNVLDELTQRSGARANAVSLEIAWESALLGAAVAVGSLEGQEDHV